MFLIDRSSLPEPTFKYSTTTCLRNECVFLACHRPVGISFLFVLLLLLENSV